jgi:hypothetical protein
MPVTCQIDGANRLIHTKCIGSITVDEVIDHFRMLEQDPSCPDRLDVLLEVRKGTSVPKRDELREVVGEIARVRGRVQFGACAIVADSDVLFGMMRMFEVFAEDQFRKTKAFRTVDAAQAWLAEQRALQRPTMTANASLI